METTQKALYIDASTGFYKVRRYKVGEYFGPVDLGLHISGRTQSLNFGVGLFAGSIFPGSNRMMFTGFSPAWRGFYVSSMGGAGLVFDNLGINQVSLVGKSPVPAVLYLNRRHGEEIEVEVEPVDLHRVWQGGACADPQAGAARRGSYALLDYALARFGGRYEGGYRAFAVGPAAEACDFGAILSAPVKDGVATDVDTWAGRGGLGSKMLQEHGIAAVVYGGTVVGDDFRDRKVADEWFEAKYKQKLAVKDFEATTKYRFDPKFETGGTLGVNYATLGGRIIAFNYRSVAWTEAERIALNERLIQGHYLKQFNEETIATKSQATCGEPCSAVCKKMRGEYKKDYEPYQALGPLCGIFDQRSAEELNRAADSAGFDGISLGGVLAWLMDCLDSGDLKPEDLGASSLPRWKVEGFDPSRIPGPTQSSGSSSSKASSSARACSISPRGPANGAAASSARRARGCSTASSIRPMAGGAGWCPTSTGRPASSRPWVSWASTTCITAPNSSRPASSGRPAPSGCARSSAWTTRGSAASTEAGARR